MPLNISYHVYISDFICVIVTYVIKIIIIVVITIIIIIITIVTNYYIYYDHLSLDIVIIFTTFVFLVKTFWLSFIMFVVIISIIWSEQFAIVPSDITSQPKLTRAHLLSFFIRQQIQFTPLLHFYHTKPKWPGHPRYILGTWASTH